MSEPTSQPTPDTPTEELIARWFDALREEAAARAAHKRAAGHLTEAEADRRAAEQELHRRLAAAGEPPRAWPYRSLVVWAEAGAVRFLRLVPKEKRR
jgi:hypothetical protein